MMIWRTMILSNKLILMEMIKTTTVCHFLSGWHDLQIVDQTYQIQTKQVHHNAELKRLEILVLTCSAVLNYVLIECLFGRVIQK